MEIRRITKENCSKRQRYSRVFFWPFKITDLFLHNWADTTKQPQYYRKLLEQVIRDLSLDPDIKSRFRKEAGKGCVATFVLSKNIGYDLHVMISM